MMMARKPLLLESLTETKLDSNMGRTVLYADFNINGETVFLSLYSLSPLSLSLYHITHK